MSIEIRRNKDRSVSVLTEDSCETLSVKQLDFFRRLYDNGQFKKVSDTIRFELVDGNRIAIHCYEDGRLTFKLTDKDYLLSKDETETLLYGEKADRGKVDRIVLNIPHAKKDLNGAVYRTNISDEVEKWTDCYTDKIFPVENAFVSSVISKYSRFYCDCERLLNDELTLNGNGIYYTKFNGIERVCREDEAEEVYRYYLRHIDDLRKEICKHKGKSVLLIDCHSFPQELSEDVDVCIGYNDDGSRPDKATIDLIAEHFKGYGLKVGINSPYSNSFSPKCDTIYRSVMIELNKRIYYNEGNKTAHTESIKAIIAELYNKLLKIQ